MRSYSYLIPALGIFLSAHILPINGQAIARETVISSERNSVNLTIYQDPNRFGRSINANWPRGYALISEKRTITIPAGETQIRFEGVSEGMFPESAVVYGLPQGVIEKNRDERLLSPFGLVDAYLKRRVTIKRTNGETGAITEKEAFITAGPTGGVVLESDEGFEALRCTGLPERIIYPKAPEDLSAKPTLSIITQSDREVRATVTLTYLASGFDWQANYIANIDPDAIADGVKKMDLFAWLTVANGGNQSFDNANLMAIAGSPNRENTGRQIRPTGKGLRLQCWPQGRTHQIEMQDKLIVTGVRAELQERGFVTLADAVNELPAVRAVIKAEQENLGDLKLYRIPEKVDVKAKGQKQVAMIVQPDAQYRRIYKVNALSYGQNFTPLSYILLSKNDKEKGLGLPLPAGRFSVFENSGYGPLLVGEGSIDDRAIGNKIEWKMPQSPSVQMTNIKLSEKGRKSSFQIKISNANSHPITAEIALDIDTKRGKSITMIDGIPTWVITIPANDEAILTYKVKRPKS